MRFPGAQRRGSWVSRICLGGVLTAAAVVAAPGTGPANALDGCGGGTAGARSAAAAGAAGASSAVARTGGTALALSSTTEATVTAADPTDPTPPATDDPSPEDRPTGDATVSDPGGDDPDGDDPGGDDPSDPSPTTETPGETESPVPTDPAEPVSLSVTAEASPSVVEQGDTLVLTIAVSNDGPGDDPGVVVDPQLPDGLSIQKVDGGGFDEGTGLWDVGELVAGETRYLVFSMTVTSESDQVSAGPTVTGEAADPVPMDDQDCTTVEVTPSSPGTQPAGPGGGGPRGEGDAPPTSAVPGSTTPDDRGTPSTDDPAPTSATGGGDTTASPGRPGGPGADDETAVADPLDPTASTGTAGDAEAAQTTSDVSSDRTSSEAALLMLAWMLVVAGVVLLVLGRLHRKKLPAWYV